MKKLVSSALAALMAVCMISMGFSASAAASVTLFLSPNYTAACPGDTVSVSVKLSGAKAAGGVVNAGPVSVKFDSKKFSFVSAAAGALIGSADFFSNLSGAEVLLDYNDATGGTKPVKTDGTLFVVKLKVKSGVTSGSSALSLSVPKSAVADAKGTVMNTTVKGTTIKFAASIAASSVKVSGATLVVKGTKQLSVAVSPGNASNKTVTWKSSDSAIAAVSAKGVVTAKKPGTVKITATTANKKTASGTVTVKAAATGVKVSGAGSIYVKDTKQLKATVSPANALDTVTWKSSNTAVATVSAKGLVTAKKAGTAKITATTHNKKTVTVTVTVQNRPAVTGVKITGAATIGVKETRQLTAAVAPSAAANKTVTWKSSNTAVATVSAKGLVTAKKAGTAKITATTHNKKTHTVTITVKAAPTKVTLNKTSASLAVKKTLTLSAALNSGAASSKLTWKSSSTAIAKVSSSGVVTAVKKGTATITVTTFNGKTASCKITVK